MNAKGEAEIVREIVLANFFFQKLVKPKFCDEKSVIPLGFERCMGLHLLIPSFQGWRACYYLTGGIAAIVAILTGITLTEPARHAIGENTDQHCNKRNASLWRVLTQPRMILLMIAASIRHCGGMTFGYNADLYYTTYFPDVDLGWWLFAVTVGIGSIGVVVGGIVSDKIVPTMGVKSRVLLLAISQFIAAPLAWGSVYYDPLWAMITLGISYFFGMCLTNIDYSMNFIVHIFLPFQPKCGSALCSLLSWKSCRCKCVPPPLAFFCL